MSKYLMQIQRLFKRTTNEIVEMKKWEHIIINIWLWYTLKVEIDILHNFKIMMSNARLMISIGDSIEELRLEYCAIVDFIKPMLFID